MAKVITASTVRNDGTALKMCQMIDTDVPILLISREEDLNFNPEILSLSGKPYVVVDFIEEGWNTEIQDSLFIGEGVLPNDFVTHDGWAMLDSFMLNQPPRLYFKRELLSKDASDYYLPIEYPSWQEDYPLQTREDFHNRPINVFNYWGRSHEARLILHGEIWKNAARRGYTVCDNLYQFNHFMHHEKDNKNKWVTCHIPFYDRQNISEIMKINAISKLSISLFGSGRKCFRHSESPYNSIMVMAEDNFAWTFEWKHGFNCIKFPLTDDITGVAKEWHIIERIEDALNRNDLYDIYVNSKVNMDKYRIDNYVKHLEKIINNV